MKTQTQVTSPQALTNDEFSFPDETEITVNEGPEQIDINTAPVGELENKEEIPLVGEVAEDKPKETKADKPAVEAEPEKDFVTTMRENNLEVFTKELFTNDVSDKEFADKLITDKFLGRKSYEKEIDFAKEYDFLPDEAITEVNALKNDIARRVANLSPEDKKTMGESKGSDEELYNEALHDANNNLGKMAAISVAIGAGATLAAPAIGVGAMAAALTVASLEAFGTMYLTVEALNAADRAMKTSPEDIKKLNITKEDKQGLLYLANDLVPTQFTQDFIDSLQREEDDSDIERFAKEFTSVAIDGGIFKAISMGYKGIKAGAKGTAKVLRRTPNPKQSPELAETIEKINDLVRIKKVAKLENKRVVQAKESFDDIINNYESVAPPIPLKAAANAVDYDKLAGEAYTKMTKSNFQDLEAEKAFNYYTAKGSNYKLGTKRTTELAKDASEADLAKISDAKKFGKGSEGTGTVTMDLANKIDEIGEQRKFAINRGDFELDARLARTQNTLMNRVTVAATQQGGNLQEINRSMPLRRQIVGLQNDKTQIALTLKRDGLTKKFRASLTKDLAKIDHRLEVLSTGVKSASNTELTLMAAANTIYSNMLSGAAIPKAALGGLISTATNNSQLLARGVSPKQIFKMQVNAAKQLANDVNKLDLSQLGSDITHGTINNRFKSKNVANLSKSGTDSPLTKGLKAANKVVNVTAAPIQGGLGLVDNMLDTFNSRQRVTEAWLDYAGRQKQLGRTSDELVEELNKFADTPEEMSAVFNKEVLEAAEEGLSTDKMMLKGPHSKGYFVSKPAWGIDRAFNTTSDSLILNTTLKFVNPFTRTGASMLDSIAENTALGMFRTSAANGAIAAITPRQMLGTASSIALFYGLESDIEVVPQQAEKIAGSMGLRTGIQVGGHQFPMAILGVYGEVIEKFQVMQNAMEAASLDGTDTSNISPILGGLLEVATVTGMARNLKDIAQKLMNVPEGKSKVEVTKLIESFMPAGYVLKAGADLTEGSLASNPYWAQVSGAYDTEFGNAKRRSAFGTPISEGETLEMDRNLSWLIDRKGANKSELEMSKMLLDSGVFTSEKFAAFKTDEKLIPYSTINVDGNFTKFSATMTPLSYAVTLGSGTQLRATSATRNKALGVMSLDKKTMHNILKDEYLNLKNMEVNSPEGKFIRDNAMNQIKQLNANTQGILNNLSKYGMNKTLPKALKMLLEKQAPNITDNFDQKGYEVSNLMRYNRSMFNGDIKKQRTFFSRVNRVKDTVLFYNSIKNLGSTFMKYSAESVKAEMERVEKLKSKK